MLTVSRHGRALRTLFAAGAATGALALAMPAYAQTAPAEDDAADGDIVVTAQFREQRLQDTPLSITAVDAELLEARNQTDLGQIALQAPNVTLNPMGGAYGSSLGASIRGIGQFDFNPAYEPGVGMYIDDVYYATLTGGIFDLLDLDRIEVLRGPQGTLTGRNSIGGAIKLYSTRPGPGDEGMVELVYGSRDRIDVRGSANFELAEGLYARISGVYKHQNGYVDQVDYGCANPGNAQGIAATLATGSGCVIDRLGERGYAGVRGSLRYNPSDNFDLVVTADYTYEDRTNAAEVVSTTTAARAQYICGRFCTYASFFAPAGGQIGAYRTPNTTTFEGWGLSANMTIGLSDTLNLQSITAYRDYSQYWGTDDDFTPDPSIAGQGINDLSFWFFSQELRLNGSLGDNVDFTVGGYYSDQRSVYFTQQDIRYIAPGLNFQFQGNDPVNADSQALFATVFFRPVENLTLTGGIRYTEESKDYTFVRLNYDGSVSTFLGALNGVTATYSGSQVDWRLSADYRFSPEVLAYITVGTGFKGGGVTARPFNAAQALLGSFDPETVTAYEIGFKTDLFDRHLRLNVSGFINDYQDIQLPIVDCTNFGGPAPCGVRTNAGSGQIRGLEFELSARPVEGMMIDGTLSYIDSEWDSIAPAVGTAININDPIATPRWKWSFGAQYAFDLGDSGSLTPRFDVAYTGRTSAGRAIGNVLEYFESYTLVNARLTWRNADEDLSISLEAQNLFNEYYQPFRFAAVYSFTGTAYSQVGRPREYAITVRKTF